MAFTPTDSVVDDVMARFDFEKAHKLMVFLDWKWTDCGGVPSIEDLKANARDRLNSAMSGEGEHGGCWSGGFKANRGFGYLSLDFCPVESRELIDNAKRVRFYTPMTKEEIEARRRKFFNANET